MLDFTSALYLGMNHPHRSLRPWPALTTGRPAAREPPPGAQALAEDLARLIGCERATLGASTLHIFFDLFEVLAKEGVALLVDAGAYPIVRWGLDRVTATGVPAIIFLHHNPIALEQALIRSRRSGLRPEVVTDDLSPATGRPAPLDHYLRLGRAHHGWLVIDDTQALGILGEQPTPEAPLGRGGSGAAWQGLRASELIVAASLAKGFGAPLAVLAGSRGLIETFESQSACRVHCSAPSAAHLAAAAHALALNRRQGDHLRRQLMLGVQRFRRRLRAAGLAANGGFFPVQTPFLGRAPAAIHAHLLADGIRTVLHQPREGFPAQVSFLHHRGPSVLANGTCRRFPGSDHQPWARSGPNEANQP